MACPARSAFRVSVASVSRARRTSRVSFQESTRAFSWMNSSEETASSASARTFPASTTRAERSLSVSSHFALVLNWSRAVMASWTFL